MSKPDFTDLFNQLLDIDNRLRLFRRKEKLRNRLKILGIGFLIYKNVQREIEKLLPRRQGLLENLVPSTSGHMEIFAICSRITESRIFTVNIDKKYKVPLSYLL